MFMLFSLFLCHLFFFNMCFVSLVDTLCIYSTYYFCFCQSFLCFFSYFFLTVCWFLQFLVFLFYLINYLILCILLSYIVFWYLFLSRFFLLNKNSMISHAILRQMLLIILYLSQLEYAVLDLLLGHTLFDSRTT